MGAGSFPRSFVLTVAVAGLAARLAFGLVYWVDEKLNRDEVEYLSLARSLAAGHGYVYDEHVANGPVQGFGRAPGYPAFLALTGGGVAGSVERVPVSVKIAQSFAGAIGVVLIAVAAFRLGGAGSARAAAAIAAIYPPLIWVSGYAYSESIFWPIGLGLALVMSRALEQKPGVLFPEKYSRLRMWEPAIVLGLFTGVSILVRAATLLFVPLSAVWLIYKRRWITLAGMAIGLVLVLTPWTIRNLNFYGHFVLVASDGGVTFWTGNNKLATGEGDMAANPHLKLANQELRARHPHLGEEQMEPIYYQESIGWIREHPGDFLWLMARKVFYVVVPIGPSYKVHSARYFWASVLSYGLLLPLAAIGAWRLGSRRSRLAGMWILAAAAVATCLVFFPQERFRIPVIDPALILLASGLWASGYLGDAQGAAGRRAA
jgi:4-amino-4-deoxy-L-arabinose transferase-like glycosyltransferase